MGDASVPMWTYLFVDEYGVVHNRLYNQITVCGINFTGQFDGKVSSHRYDLEVTCLECVKRMPCQTS